MLEGTLVVVADVAAASLLQWNVDNVEVTTTTTTLEDYSLD